MVLHLPQDPFRGFQLSSEGKAAGQPPKQDTAGRRLFIQGLQSQSLLKGQLGPVVESQFK